MSAWLAASALLIGAQATPAASAGVGVQQRFEQSTAALQAGKWAEALAGFEALERQLATGKGGQSLGLIRVRKGEALLNLGRFEEARAALEQGLSALPASAASLREDRMLSHLMLGELAERALDYGEAQEQFRAAEPLAETAVERLRALRGLVQTGLFFNGPEALANIDRALALVAAEAPGNKNLLARLRTLKGRTLLNLGRPAEARTELEAAVAALGGLTTRVDAADLSARSDLSLALLQIGDKENARKYLAYTGAGRLEQELGRGADMTPPSCGEEGLAPQDVAVVEFSIRGDGSIGHVAPIYSSRQGSSALAFAQAVSRWSWQPDAVAKIPPLLRALTRVELRCSTAGARPDTLDLLEADAAAWFGAAKLAPVTIAEVSEARRVAPLRSELVRRETQSGAASPQLLPVLVALGGNETLPLDERAALYQRALGIAQAAAAPADVLAFLKVRQFIAAEEGDQPDFRRLSADPQVSASPRAAAAVRLLHSKLLDRGRKRDQAKAVLEQASAMPGLAPTDPIRVATLLRLSSLELASGDVEAARSAYAATGLTDQQCALVDPGPAKASGNFSASDFPDEAMQWGFEGFAVIEYDVLADGKVANNRAVIAYPPFVFGDSSARRIGTFRFNPSFRPSGGIGCGGKQQTVRFVLPDWARVTI